MLYFLLPWQGPQGTAFLCMIIDTKYNNYEYRRYAIIKRSDIRYQSKQVKVLTLTKNNFTYHASYLNLPKFILSLFIITMIIELFSLLEMVVFNPLRLRKCRPPPASALGIERYAVI